MSIEFRAVQTDDLKDYCKQVQVLLNDGWQVVYHHVYYGTLEPVFEGEEQELDYESYSDAPIYLSYLQRDTATATLQKNGVYLASLMEVLEKRVNQHEDRLDVLEATADTDDVITPDSIPVFNPFGTLIGWIGETATHYAPMIDEMIAEEGSAS